MFPIPWQQFGKPALWDVGDAAEDVGEPSQRIDVIELGRHDQRGHGGSPVGATFGAGEEPGFKTNAYRALVDPRDWACGFISRADVANFLIKQIDEDAFLHKTPVLMN
jgi:hypothetical protein